MFTLHDFFIVPCAKWQYAVLKLYFPSSQFTQFVLRLLVIFVEVNYICRHDFSQLWKLRVSYTYFFKQPCYRLRFEQSDLGFRAGANNYFLKHPYILWRQPMLMFSLHGGQSVQLIYLHLVTRLRITGAIPLFPYMLSRRGQRQLYFFFIFTSVVLDQPWFLSSCRIHIDLIIPRPRILDEKNEILFGSVNVNANSIYYSHEYYARRYILSLR
jgi:hypothetical protein